MSKSMEPKITDVTDALMEGVEAISETVSPIKDKILSVLATTLEELQEVDFVPSSKLLEESKELMDMLIEDDEDDDEDDDFDYELDDEDEEEELIP